ncbi:WD40 repeat domain-containing serine/threonine-protein kinase [Lyngbya sp. CCY1209]|jgi:serine/threonine protein kinase|uniref:WD40 repeat domain-containing serine/threonine-protein kinase n=1 Tax=Lyngbya sp. CCY1209 TaxID=2886103 RepID=UPI002D1FDD22|nr:WD40 repeat domain-containing serine/threonine-protein kinase [Lyngbya sp. CCY1209]MEB3887294.1 protein kinase [Lyngbya sp. CCY1209]
MSYCLNPQCPHPQNPDDGKFCLTCGAKLLLRERYRAIAPIGHGGFGKTFLAVDEDKPSRPACVIKQFFPQTQGAPQARKAAELFHREAVRLDELGKHPQIPDLLAHFEQDKNQYLVQEYIDGANLEEELTHRGPFAETQIRQLLDDLLPVLQFVHQSRVIHRDIKPANIIRRGQAGTATGQLSGQLVLVDFGAAKVVTDTQLPGTGTVIGSPEYVAPEQTRGQAVYASDIYSLGVTCLHLLTQISPFDLYDIHEDRWVWRDYLRGPAIADSLGSVLDRMVATLPNQRYESALDVLKALHPGGIPPALLGGLPGVGTPPPAIARPSPSPQTGASRTVQQPPTPKFSRVAPLRSTARVPLHTLTGHRDAVTSVAFSPDGKTLASGSEDLTIEIWKADVGKRWYTLTGHEDWVTSVAFSPDGQTLASGSRDQTVEIWDLKKGKRWYTLSGHADRVYGVAFSPDGQTLASASRDRTVRLWDLKRSRELATLDGWPDWVRTVAFGPDGRVLAGGCRDGSIRLWQYRGDSWQLWRTLRADDTDIFAIALSPDGSQLTAGNRRGNIDLWQVNSGTLLETISAHSGDVLSLAFAPDGNTLASGGSDRLVKLWNL